MSAQNVRFMPGFVITAPPLNPDRDVNYSCNLKWKPGDKENNRLSPSTAFKGKMTSKPSG